MATEWKVIRVASEVLGDLQSVREAMRYSSERSLLDVDYTQRGNITDNSVVAYLIRHYKKHAARRAKSAILRRERREGSRGAETVAVRDAVPVPGDSGGRSGESDDALGLPAGTLAEPAGPAGCPQYAALDMPTLLLGVAE